MRGIGFDYLGEQDRLIFGCFDPYSQSSGFATQTLRLLSTPCIGAGKDVRFGYSTANYGLQVSMSRASLFARLVCGCGCYV